MPFFAPQNNHEHSMRYVTITRLIVGKRHCRVLNVGKCANLLTLTAVSAALEEDRTFVDLSLSRTLLPNQSETIRFNLN